VVESTRPAARDGDGDDGVSPLALLGGIVVTLVAGGYMVVYATNKAASERYAGGFVIQYCPVCQAGALEIEERFYRVAGIPRVRRAVRCNNCRSVLREVGNRRWRYAVDRVVSPELYGSLNNRILRESQLADLAPDSDDQFPQYIDDLDDSSADA
jgi:hypothetical protein